MEEILDRLGVVNNREKAKALLHDAFKDYVELQSTTKLDTYDMERFLNMIRMLFSRERGWVLREPNEEVDIENLSMRVFLKYKLHGRTI